MIKDGKTDRSDADDRDFSKSGLGESRNPIVASMTLIGLIKDQTYTAITAL